ncbi:hypothetical protein [Pandoraea pulmonicola]|uniref:hypothetical protein n=1 Tax=Pandoraea pulmonicola TaxID=93221 RepID=UPI0011C06094|nr:hypothetical protein [Pandoraea pulmonicola]
MLVSNVLTTARAGSPWDVPRPDGPAGDIDVLAPLVAVRPDMPVPVEAASTAPPEVVHVAAVPIEIKTSYTLIEFLEVLGSSETPFTNSVDTVLDAYTMLTGKALASGMKKTIRQWTRLFDEITNLIPKVQLSRMPGKAATFASERLQNKEVESDQIVDWLQFADPHPWRSAAERQVPQQDSVAPSQREPTRNRASATQHEGPAAEVAPRPGERQGKMAIARDGELESAAASQSDGARPKLPSKIAGEIIMSDVGLAAGETLVATHPKIEGEREHLQGYAHSLSQENLPSSVPRRLLFVDGRFYIRGDFGYYHATRGTDSAHWLINAPRGSNRRAQVPIEYDAELDTWRAQAPLRLCGGGCVQSRLPTADSIIADDETIQRAIEHLEESKVRNAIRRAFNDLARLQLKRSNRPDLRATRDHSIIDRRTDLRALMQNVDPNAPLHLQQREAAFITTMYYHFNPGTEAFCQENAEILLHFLISHGIPSQRLRMITVQPWNRAPHALVLYTESPELIAKLSAATPHPPTGFDRDGISGREFVLDGFHARRNTILLDPWSRTRATAFVHADSAEAVGKLVEAALADTGLAPGAPYSVALTRLYRMSRTSVSSSGNSASSGSLSSGRRPSSTGSGSTVQLRAAIDVR